MAKAYFEIDGQRFDLPDYSSLTGRESSLIKRQFGVRAGELQEALGAGDTDALLGLVAVAILRATGEVDVDKLYDTPLTKVRIVEEKDEDADEPAETADPQAAGDAPADAE